MLTYWLQTPVLTSWCEDRIANYFPQYLSQANQPGSFCLVYGTQDEVGVLRGRRHAIQCFDIKDR